MIERAKIKLIRFNIRSPQTKAGRLIFGIPKIEDIRYHIKILIYLGETLVAVPTLLKRVSRLLISTLALPLLLGSCAFLIPAEDPNAVWIQEHKLAKELMEEKKMVEAGEHLLKSLRYIKEHNVTPSIERMTELIDSTSDYINYQAEHVDDIKGKDVATVSAQVKELEELATFATNKATVGPFGEVSDSITDTTKKLKNMDKEIEAPVK